MKVETNIYVLQNDRNPIKFLNNTNKDGVVDGEYIDVDNIMEATHCRVRKAAELILNRYNNKTLHMDKPNYHIVPVTVTYEF